MRYLGKARKVIKFLVAEVKEKRRMATIAIVRQRSLPCKHSIKLSSKSFGQQQNVSTVFFLIWRIW